MCLDKDFTLQIWKKKNVVEEQQTCSKDTAIPLHYEPLQKSAPPHNERDPPLHDKDQSVVEAETSVTWHRTLKVLLLKKAAIALFTLARSAALKYHAGKSLRLLKISLQCYGQFSNYSSIKHHGCMILQIIPLAHLMHVICLFLMNNGLKSVLNEVICIRNGICLCICE